MTPSRLHFPPLALAMLSLILAVLAGLMRLGWAVPTIDARWMAAHGPLMVAGFLGTLITLERAVALGRRWMYAAAALSGLGGLLLLAGFPQIARLLAVLGSLGLVLIFVVILRRHLAAYTVTMALGALAWLAGNVLWLAGWSVPRLVPWWGAFLILTIAGERLELGRLVDLPPGARTAFGAAVALLGSGLLVSLAAFDGGVRIAGAGMVVLSIWLYRFDVARKTVRKPGLTRFIAVCMLGGYVWLAVGGLLGVVWGGVTGGAGYDAQLHAVFLGFVFSMIFGHAPVIFPAIMGRAVGYSPLFYIHLAFLHASLALRIAGDLLDAFLVRRWGGMLNAVALLIFLVNTVRAVLRSKNTLPFGKVSFSGDRPDA